MLTAILFDTCANLLQDDDLKKKEVMCACQCLCASMRVCPCLCTYIRPQAVFQQYSSGLSSSDTMDQMKTWPPLPSKTASLYLDTLEIQGKIASCNKNALIFFLLFHQK